MQTIQSNRRFRPQIKHDTGCRRARKPARSKHPPVPASNDFLRHRFSTIIADREENWNDEQDYFFSTLAHVEAYYNLPPTPRFKDTYPINIRKMFQHIKEKVDAVSEYERLFLIRQEQHPYCLATATVWDTNYTLYFIPLARLYTILHKRELKAEAGILLSVCAYLYQMVEIPSFTKGDSLSGMYDMILNWVEEESNEWDEGHYENVYSEYEKLKFCGAKLHKALKHPYHVQQWPTRLQQFKPGNEKGRKLQKLATDFIDLYTKFPDRKFHDYIMPGYWHPEREERTCADEYISFVWDNDDWIGDQVFQCVNEKAGNSEIIDEPLQFKAFDEPSGRQTGNTEFESSLFNLMADLANLLETICHDND